MNPHAAEVAMPPVETRTLAHGVLAAVSALPTVPLVQAHLAIDLRPRTVRELAVLDVLAACWPALPACARFEQHGGVVTVTRQGRWLLLSLTGPAERLPLITRAFAAAVHARYDDAQVRTAASRAAQQAALAEAQPAAQTTRLLWQEYYGHLPAFLAPAPDPRDVLAVTVADVTAAHARTLTPRHCVAVLVGDLDHRAALDGLEEALADWTADPAARPYRYRQPPRPALRRITTRAHPGLPQSHLRLAGTSPSRRDLADFAAGQVAALVLGGAFSARINRVLREERGLAYRTTALVTDHLDGDVLVVEADVRPSATAEATDTLLRILADFADHGPTEAELRAAVGNITGKYALNVGAQSTRAALMLSFLTLGIPLDAIARFPAHVAALSREDVHRAAALHHPDRLTGIVRTDPA
ncbi:M16 family metallopeptidase [Kitasatospora sp. NPDC089509]|uniref:M16 family metallopeptidase n=1 Tax=Kitasatospora sp. NPDC089509 TaxID=3364079 RepID=UPI003809BDA4